MKILVNENIFFLIFYFTTFKKFYIKKLKKKFRNLSSNGFGI